jgi:ATP-dependent helicase HrpA
VLIKAIEDTALGLASVYRSLELPLPKQLPYASKEIRTRWADLIARVMPFDLVIDEHTADGQEARVSKTSVAGSWGAVAGALRFFADRFGVARASIEGTTISYDLVNRYAVLGQPRVILTGPRKHQRLALQRRRSYFGFELDTEIAIVGGKVPEGLQAEARDLLAEALMAGEAEHPDATRIRRAVSGLDELWRRSGGRLEGVSPEAIRRRLRQQLETVGSWEDFQRTHLALDPAELVDEPTRQRLDALPGMVRVRGDAAPVEYEVQRGEGVARVRLREGQAKRLRADEVPVLDRPVRFAVQRGRHPPILADTVADLQALLRRAPKPEGRRASQHGRRPGRRR